MRKYQKLYDDAVSKRTLERNNYTKIQFTSPEIKRKDVFKKIYKNIWYFYLIGIVLVAVVLLIICVKRNDLFNKIWLSYIFILAINTFLMLISLGITKQVIENKANEARDVEETIMNSAEEANLYLAKLCTILITLDMHGCYINSVENKEEETLILTQKYIEIINKELNNRPTNEEIINYYRNLLLSSEKKG